ncbi:uncharacterized protein si:dkeyp-77h1.4 [Conger conger]|uniref:uncharacterized protein si:dkeyp-77h1.4 n=1 Tax=Conger conger TaxID=82655 RepID=UPI002A5B0C16|nr:uncharacterized protein si:dkeyp-77h1.4 [Conger conger]
MAFLGEDFHIIVPSPQTTEVLFRRRWAAEGSEQVLMREGQVLSPRVQLVHRNRLQVLRVGQSDAGTYIIKYSDEPEDVKHIILSVQDCFIDENVKYGDSFSIPLKNLSGPISLEFRPHAESNVTASPMVLIFDRSRTAAGEYAARTTAQEARVTLNTVTSADRGSYTVLDSERSVVQKVCLNVKAHQNFVKLPYSGTLKINLLLNVTRVKVLYIPNKDFRGRVILDQGELAFPADLDLEGRLSLDGPMLILERVRGGDVGTFSVVDLQGFTVSDVHLDEVEGFKLPPLVVAVISLLSLLVLLLFVCLVSCLVKVHRRAVKARAVEKIAQNAGKDEGDTFRQVVQDAYTRFNEESTTQSQCDSTTTKTEVDIKGLEVSKNLLEMSDSGVEFNAPGLPLDSDTDVPPAYTSPKLPLESELQNSTVVPESMPTVNQTPDAKPTVNQIPDSKPPVNQTPDSKPSTDKTLDPKPSTDKTPDAKPSTDKTPDPKPSTDKTPDPKPSMDKTPDPKPSTDKTPDPKPSSDKTPDPQPSTDQTLAINLGVNGTTGGDSKLSNSATPEPVAKAAPEAAAPDAAPEPVAKPPEPSRSGAPSSDADTGAAAAHDGPASDADTGAAPAHDGPASQAEPEAAPPGESPPSPAAT